MLRSICSRYGCEPAHPLTSMAVTTAKVGRRAICNKPVGRRCLERGAIELARYFARLDRLIVRQGKEIGWACEPSRGPGIASIRKCCVSVSIHPALSRNAQCTSVYHLSESAAGSETSPRFDKAFR